MKLYLSKVPEGLEGITGFIGKKWLEDIRNMFLRTSYTVEDFYESTGNSSTTETDLHSVTLPRYQLANSGERLAVDWSGYFVQHATASKRLKVYFQGTQIFDSGALTNSGAVVYWNIKATIMRVDASTIRYSFVFVGKDASTTLVTQTNSISVDLSQEAILKITGTAAGVGAASDQVFTYLGSVEWRAAA